MRSVSVPLFDVMEMILDGYLSEALTDRVGRLSTKDIQEFLEKRIRPFALESIGISLSEDEMLSYLESVKSELQGWSDDAFGPVRDDFYLEVVAHYGALAGEPHSSLITRSESNDVTTYTSVSTKKSTNVPSSASIEEHKRAIERLLPMKLGVC